MSTARPQTYETLDVTLAEGGTVLSLTLDQPKGNILTRSMMEELIRALAAHRDQASLRLVLLSGAGGHFSFGASIEEHRRDLAAEMLTTFHHLIRELAAYPVPVAALVSGRCLGGGFELVLACHFVFATPDAGFGCPEIKLAVFPPVLAAIGARRLGGFAAERLLLTGEVLDAATARHLGLVSQIFEAGGDPREAVLAWYRKTLQPLSAFALRQGTKALRRATGLLAELDQALGAAESQYLGEVLSSHDGNEGIDAFLARRQPVWKDR